MYRSLFGLLLTLTLQHCAPLSAHEGTAQEKALAPRLAQEMHIELLGFPSCPNTPALRDNLLAALKEFHGGWTLREVNQESLAASDIRRGWPAPTILINGADLLGMAAPTTPTMACRMYEDGLPTADRIASCLRAQQSPASTR